MSSSIGLFGLVADLVIVLVVVSTFARPGVSQLVRLLSATFAFVCAWVLTAVLDALRAPDWTMLMGGAVILLSIVMIIVNLHLWTRRGPDGENDPGRRDDHGGGGLLRPQPDPRHGDGGSDPSWWPEFERRLAFYVAERETEKREPALLPAEAGSR